MNHYLPYALATVLFFYFLYKGQKFTNWELWRSVAAGLGAMLVLRDIFTLI